MLPEGSHEITIADRRRPHLSRRDTMTEGQRESTRNNGILMIGWARGRRVTDSHIMLRGIEAGKGCQGRGKERGRYWCGGHRGSDITHITKRQAIPQIHHVLLQMLTPRGGVLGSSRRDPGARTQRCSDKSDITGGYRDTARGQSRQLRPKGLRRRRSTTG